MENLKKCVKCEQLRNIDNEYGIRDKEKCKKCHLQEKKERKATYDIKYNADHKQHRTDHHRIYGKKK